MIEVYIFLFIASFVLQLVISKKYYGHLFNPVFVFNILFFIHNWSFSLSKVIDSSLLWSTPINNDLYQPHVLLINLSCLWAYFFGAIFFSRRRRVKQYNIYYSENIYSKLYYVLTTIFTIRVFTNFLSGSIYGGDQALTSQDAFNPILIILSSRVIWGSIVLINTQNKKHLIIILIIEIILSILSGGRKSLIIILISGLFPKIEYLKARIKIKSLIKYTLIFFIIGYMIAFVAFFRLTSKDSLDFSDRFTETIQNINLYGSNLTFVILNSANSEGVQNWTYKLIKEEEIEKTYGLSYLQAIVNMVILRPFQGKLAEYQAAYYFKSVAYPDISNHGWDFSFTAEGILNWGYFAFVSYLLLGIFVAFLYKRKANSQFYSTLYFLLFAVLFVCMRTDSTSLMRYLSFYLLSFPVFRFFHLIKRKKERIF